MYLMCTGEMNQQSLSHDCAVHDWQNNLYDSMAALYRWWCLMVPLFRPQATWLSLVRPAFLGRSSSWSLVKLLNAQMHIAICHTNCNATASSSQNSSSLVYIPPTGPLDKPCRNSVAFQLPMGLLAGFAFSLVSFRCMGALVLRMSLCYKTGTLHPIEDKADVGACLAGL